MNIKDISNKYSISPESVRRAISLGKVRASKVDGEWFVDEDSFAAWRLSVSFTPKISIGGYIKAKRRRPSGNGTWEFQELDRSKPKDQRMAFTFRGPFREAKRLATLHFKTAGVKEAVLLP